MTNYSLLELNEYIRRFVALNVPEAIWVEAEIAEISERRGHYYFSLVEKAAEEDHLVAQSQAVFWDKAARKWQRTNKLRLSKVLRTGQSVQVKVLVDFHERYGLKLIVEDINPTFSLGQLAIRRQQTIETLQEKGVFDLNKEKALAAVPQRLAIISSPVAAGLQDFLAQLAQNKFGYQFHTQVFPAAVQGEQAAKEISRQIRAIGRRVHTFDAIVIIRGGGAKTDLADFDDLKLCETAAEAALPIIAGIGHQTDESVLDMVAHSSLKTPTAAATFVIERLTIFEQNLLQQGHQIQQLAARRLQEEDRFLLHLKEQLLRVANQRAQKENWQLTMLSTQLKQSAKLLIQKEKIVLENYQKTNELLSLDAALSRGFVWLSQQNKAISSAKKLKKDTAITAHFKDGEKELFTK